MSGLETHGLEQIPEAERTAKTRELFPTWVAALDFWQTLVVGVTAPIVSYGLVGLISIAGKRGGAPGMALSRAVFGQRGNLLPGALIWVARWGWETINAVTGAYALIVVTLLLYQGRAEVRHVGILAVRRLLRPRARPSGRRHGLG
ncbi:purine-cytosine permease-like protein [Streptomyces sp. SAI-127]|nr:purine-cytosine permease-like protein [Streptomyces sp. SAI-127]